MLNKNYCIIIFLIGIFGMLFFNINNVKADLQSCKKNGGDCRKNCPGDYKEIFPNNSGCLKNDFERKCCKKTPCGTDSSGHHCMNTSENGVLCNEKSCIKTGKKCCATPCSTLNPKFVCRNKEDGEVGCVTGHCKKETDQCCPKITSTDPTPATTSTATTFTNPLVLKDDIPTFLGNVIKGIMGVVGSLALVMFIYGGIIWMISGGNQENVTKGKNILIWTTLGIIMVFMAYAIVKLVIETLTT
ncbi:MAG: pilin [Patescibacteria group bacterium]